MSGIVFVLIVGVIFLKIYQVYKAVRAAQGLPRLLCAFPPLSLISFLLPTFSWNPSIYFAWKWKYFYQEKGSELVSFLPLISGRPPLYTCSPEILKQVLGFDSTFEKSDDMSTLGFLGPNVVASLGMQWRRHRKVTAPAFNQSTFRNVWKETAIVYEDMVNKEGWGAADSFVCKSFNHFTTKVALLVISACGFGLRLPWDNPPALREEVSKKEILMTVASNVLVRALTPRWAYFLPISRLSKVEKAYIEFEQFMRQHITARKSQTQKRLALDGDPMSETEDSLFRRLVQANETEEGLRLDDQELLGTISYFSLLGMTTAHALVMTLALLGINQGEQDRIFGHIRSISEHDLKFENISELSPVLSCFYEALRLYPAVYLIIREATEDTMLTFPSISRPGTEERFLARRGTQISMDVIGTNRNPRHFPEPDLFKPSRWDESVDPFVDFSYGPRACLGRKFATTEATCFLAHILRDWKVDIVLNEGETTTEWESRVLYPKLGATLTTGDVPLRFTRRAV